MKFKANIIILIVFLVMVIFSGCGIFSQSGPSICDTIPEGQTSILCAAAEKTGIPLESFGKTLEIANFGVLISSPSNANKIMGFLEDAEGLIKFYQEREENLTPDMIMNYLIQEYAILSPEAASALQIIDPMAGVQLDIPEIMSDFDIDIILGHIAKQKQIVAPFLMSSE